MSSCDILGKQSLRMWLRVTGVFYLVHPTDHQRLDMVMPGGRHIYLRAASMSERQQWLLALGVAKQGGLETDPSKQSWGHVIVM